MSFPMTEELKAKVHDQWMVFAAGYSEIVLANSFMPQVHEQYVESLVPLLKDKGPLKMLDVAAASGEPSLHLARALPEASITATDIAESYIPLGQARAESHGVTNVKFEAADGETLSNFSDDSFDALTCSLGLMFFPNEKRGLSNFYRVLKPQGILAVTVWSETVPFFSLAADAAKEIAPPSDSAPPATVLTAMRFGDGAGLVEDLKQAGFTDVEHKRIDVTFRLPQENDGDGSWWAKMWKTPFPLKAAVQAAKEAGNAKAEEQARELLTAKYAAQGFVQADGSLASHGNICHFILARKP